MTAKIIYAPIRKKYVQEHKGHMIDKAHCVFCKPKREIIVYEGNTAMIIANNYPYNTGHLLVIPKRHINDIGDMNKDEDKDVMLLIKRAVKFLDKAFKPDSFNIGLNQGEISGGSIKHVHFHVVPRYKGDNAFMEVINNTKVISYTPEEAVKIIKQKNNLR